MDEQSQENPNQESDNPPRIIADFGGRRRLLDRRSSPSGPKQKERRSGKERRCGFDRRSALNQSFEVEPDKRQTFDKKDEIDHKA